MVSLATNFSSTEVAAFLIEDGYVVGTPPFCNEMDRRYLQVADGVFEERDDWVGDRRQADDTSYVANGGDDGS